MYFVYICTCFHTKFVFVRELASCRERARTRLVESEKLRPPFEMYKYGCLTAVHSFRHLFETSLDELLKEINLQTLKTLHFLELIENSVTGIQRVAEVKSRLSTSPYSFKQVKRCSVYARLGERTIECGVKKQTYSKTNCLS